MKQNIYNTYSTAKINRNRYVNPFEQRHSKSRVAAARLGALRVYIVRGPLGMMTVFRVGSGRFARFLRTVSDFRTQSTVFDWIKPV